MTTCLIFSLANAKITDIFKIDADIVISISATPVGGHVIQIILAETYKITVILIIKNVIINVI